MIGLLGEAAWGLATFAFGVGVAVVVGGEVLGTIVGVLATVSVWAAGVLTMQHFTGWPPAD